MYYFYSPFVFFLFYKLDSHGYMNCRCYDKDCMKNLLLDIQQKKTKLGFNNKRRLNNYDFYFNGKFL